MATQAEKAQAFRALHEREGAFIIPNPWDVGTARMLANLGFEALATTSAGLAFSRGLPDGAVDRDAVIEHCREICEAVDLPVNADLGNCFGVDPKTVAETFRLAADTGLAGASVEDMADDGTIFDFDLAVERVRAACDAARALPFPFVVTARCENFLAGRQDLDDTIARLQAYREAGADVLYAPGLTTREEIAAVVREAGRPVNVLTAGKGFSLTFLDLEQLGVKRISAGSTMARTAMTAFVAAAREMKEQGTFGYTQTALSTREIEELLGP